IGRPLDTRQMEEALLRAYSLGTLASITYEVVQEDGNTGVLVRARPKTHGPNYIQVGMRAGSDFSGNHESNIRAAVLMSPISDRIGRPLDTRQMEEALLRAYSLGTLASITYEVVQEDGNTGVLVRARPKTHGPNYIQVGMRAGSDFSGNHESNIRAAVLMSPI